MNVVWQVVWLLLWIFRLLLLGRLVIEFVRVLARGWQPAGRATIPMEILFVSTDPPIKLFRKLIPTVRIGGVGFDLSVIVLLLLVQIAMYIVSSLAIASL